MPHLVFHTVTLVNDNKIKFELRRVGWHHRGESGGDRDRCLAIAIWMAAFVSQCCNAKVIMQLTVVAVWWKEEGKCSEDGTGARHQRGEGVAKCGKRYGEDRGIRCRHATRCRLCALRSTISRYTYATEIYCRWLCADGSTEVALVGDALGCPRYPTAFSIDNTWRCPISCCYANFHRFDIQIRFLSCWTGNLNEKLIFHR